LPEYLLFFFYPQALRTAVIRDPENSAIAGFARVFDEREEAGTCIVQLDI
jgi:hypothetical protein